jgi:hypothetical protein
MKREEIKNEIGAIISQMQECFDVMWSDNLEQSFQVIATEQTDKIDYNGWLERLFELQNRLNK